MAIESKPLIEFIQNTVNSVLHEGVPYDDNQKKWLHKYCIMESLDEKQYNTIDRNLELLFETLDELKRIDSSNLKDIAKICGRGCTLSDEMTNVLIAEAESFRANAIIQMNAEIEKNNEVVLIEKERYNKETSLINRCKEKQNELEEKEGTIRHIVVIRLVVIYVISLIALSLAAFLFFHTKALAWFFFVLNVISGFGILLYLLLKSSDPLTCAIPLMLFLLLFFEAFFIDAFCDRIWLLALVILLLTICVHCCFFVFFSEESDELAKGVFYFFLMLNLVIVVSLAEFFTFGDKIFLLSDDGWGWGFVSLVANIGYIGKIIDETYEGKSSLVGFLLDLLFFALLTVVAYLTHHFWKFVLIPLGVGLSFLSIYVRKQIEKRL